MLHINVLYWILLNNFWTIIVTFNFKSDRTLATVGSDESKKLLPSYINQNRNKGYTGVVPERVGDVVEGKTYTVLAGWKDFSLENILLDYNPHTFKVMISMMTVLILMYLEHIQ